MEDRLPFGSELIDRVGWLINLRWLAVAGTLLAIGPTAVWFPGSLPFGTLLGITIAIAAYNGLFRAHLKAIRRTLLEEVQNRQASGSALGQIILDLCTLIALVHFSGGIENPMVWFLVFHIIIASILLPHGTSYWIAALAGALLITMTSLEVGGVWAHHHLPLLGVELYDEPLYLLVFVGGLVLVLFLVAYLTTSIAIRLGERDRELMTSNQTCQLRSQELKELNDRLRRVDEERTRFMVLVTHELRAPISTIYSALELALSGVASAEKTRDVLERAQKRAAELLDLIRDLLNLTRIREQTTTRDQAEEVQVDDLLREVAEFMKVEAEGKGLLLEVDIAPDVAPVQALPNQIKLVWTNLLSNAIKYTESGGRVWASLTQDDEKVRGVVRDTGMGMTPEDLSHIFDEFYRAENARKVSPHGTGVGLSIVQRTVEHWGGTIEAQSELGRGSTFTFVLPRADR